DGALLALVLFGIDVTDRREAEETNERLAEAELARTKAEAANKAKMEFLAVMSHELRTPLNAIAGYAELLEMGVQGPITEPQMEYLGRIRRSQAHLLGLINDMMNFVRLETGRVVFHNSAHSARDILETIEALTSPQIDARGLSYEAALRSVARGVGRSRQDPADTHQPRFQLDQVHGRGRNDRREVRTAGWTRELPGVGHRERHPRRQARRNLR